MTIICHLAQYAPMYWAFFYFHMKEILLDKGRVSLVDDEDYNRLMAMGRWVCSKGYAVKRKKYWKLDGKRSSRTISMHRVIMNPSKEMCIDHIDGNPLNNQKSNLRICTHGENMRNCKTTRKNNTSGFRGVYLHKASNMWHSRISL